MVVRANEISKLIKDAIQQATDDVTITNVGTVISIGDGIANVYGLSQVMASELVEFPKSGTIGLAFNLEEESVGVIVLGEYKEIEEGEQGGTFIEGSFSDISTTYPIVVQDTASGDFLDAIIEPLVTVHPDEVSPAVLGSGSAPRLVTPLVFIHGPHDVEFSQPSRPRPLRRCG